MNQNLLAMQETWFDLWVGKIPWRRAWQPSPSPLEKGQATPLHYSFASLVTQMVKNLPAMCETWIQSLGGNIPWRRAWQPTPVSLPGEFPWTAEPGRLQSMGSQRIGHGWVMKHTHASFSYSNVPKFKKYLFAVEFELGSKQRILTMLLCFLDYF